jgi:hypothetical protein
MTYPADLALHLNKLSSFLVHGNPLDVLHQQKLALTANSENEDDLKLKRIRDVNVPIKSNPAVLSILHQSSELAIHKQSTVVGSKNADSTANLNISKFISEPRKATTSIRGADGNTTLLKKSTLKVNPFVAQAEAKLAAIEAAEASSLVVTTVGKKVQSSNVQSTSRKRDVIDLTSSSTEIDAKKLKRMKNKEKKKQNKEQRKTKRELKKKEKVASILDQPGSDVEESDDIGDLCDSDLDVVSSANVTVTNGNRELRDRPVIDDKKLIKS